jgi:hypothetical protein
MTKDTNITSGPAIKRYKIGYHTDEWGVRSSTPGGITDPSGQWVLYKDHLAALESHGQAPAQAAPAAVMVPHEQMTEEIDNVLSDPDTQLSPGAERALRWLRTWTDAPLVLSAAPTSQPAPQQEAQEPVMIYHGGCTIDCGEHGHHNVELLRTIPAGSKLYTKPQQSPVAQGDALDAVAAEREACAQECLRQAGLTVPSYDTAVACAAAIRARAAQEGK